MKLPLFFICILSCCVMAVGQSRIQQVVVKTKGRLMDDGKVKPGARLSDVLISIKDGNTWASDNRGELTFLVNSDNMFEINMVKKEGYALADPDIIGRKLKHTTSPLYIILEIPTERMRQQLNIEFKIRTILMDRIKKKEEEIEELKRSLAITENDYKARIRVLYKEQENHPMLIKSMAQEYADIDFDLADDFEKQFAHFLLNGELNRADSLLSTRGKIEDDIAELNKQRADNKEMKEELRRSSAYEQLRTKRMADFCMSKYLLHLKNNQLDSAIYYIEKRAECDTTNAEWQYEASSIIYNKSSDSVKARALYERALRHTKK